jgi:hypothetical protein
MSSGIKANLEDTPQLRGYLIQISYPTLYSSLQCIQPAWRAREKCSSLAGQAAPLFQTRDGSGLLDYYDLVGLFSYPTKSIT